MPENLKKQRTNLQNRALHKWFRELANECNQSGLEQVVKIEVDVPWNEWSVKTLFKKIAKAQFGKYHTSELTKKELQAVYETLNRALAESGVHVPFPNMDEIMFSQA